MTNTSQSIRVKCEWINMQKNKNLIQNHRQFVHASTSWFYFRHHSLIHCQIMSAAATVSVHVLQTLPHIQLNWPQPVFYLSLGVFHVPFLWWLASNFKVTWGRYILSVGYTFLKASIVFWWSLSNVSVHQHWEGCVIIHACDAQLKKVSLLNWWALLLERNIGTIKSI